MLLDESNFDFDDGIDLCPNCGQQTLAKYARSKSCDFKAECPQCGYFYERAVDFFLSGRLEIAEQDDLVKVLRLLHFENSGGSGWVREGIIHRPEGSARKFYVRDGCLPPAELEECDVAWTTSAATDDISQEEEIRLWQRIKAARESYHRPRPFDPSKYTRLMKPEDGGVQLGCEDARRYLQMDDCPPWWHRKAWLHARQCDDCRALLPTDDTSKEQL